MRPAAEIISQSWFKRLSFIAARRFGLPARTGTKPKLRAGSFDRYSSKKNKINGGRA
jgi:hypothetical protein